MRAPVHHGESSSRLYWTGAVITSRRPPSRDQYGGTIRSRRELQQRCPRSYYLADPTDWYNSEAHVSILNTIVRSCEPFPSQSKGPKMPIQISRSSSGSHDTNVENSICRTARYYVLHRCLVIEQSPFSLPFVTNLP